MKIPLSPRLLACADAVGKVTVAADIGCDHGYLGLYLLSRGQADFIYNADIRPEPLAAARRNGIKYGMADKMEYFLCDGAESIPQDAQVFICAGMGADTIMGILESSPFLKKKRLILQCQSKTYCLRRYLSENGFKITKETAVADGRFVYTVMEVIAGQMPLTPGQCFLSPALLREQTADAALYRARAAEGLRKAVTLRKAPEPFLVDAYHELEGLL